MPLRRRNSKAVDRAREDLAAGEIDGLHTFVRSSIVRVQVYADRVDITLIRIASVSTSMR